MQIVDEHFVRIIIIFICGLFFGNFSAICRESQSSKRSTSYKVIAVNQETNMKETRNDNVEYEIVSNEIEPTRDGDDVGQFDKNVSTKQPFIDTGHNQEITYPKRVLLIIGSEFCERFNFYGMKAILALYLTNKLGYSEDEATILYHLFTMSVNLMCIFGAIVSDAWLGRFKTIFYLSIIYAFGSVLISVSSIQTLHISTKSVLFAGLCLSTIGSGGIKTCATAFGADQFQLPKQTAALATYFSMFYFTINLGSMLSDMCTPMLRANVHCFGQNDCFPLAFGVPAILMTISIVLFLCGKSRYTIVEIPSKNMITQVLSCIMNAILTKFRESRSKPRQHFLDYSIDKYGQELVDETDKLLKLLVLFVPLPIFWALFDQQGSRWTFQASKMNGDIGFYTIQPDQMQMINSLFILILIPFFNVVIYPLLKQIGLRWPVQKMACGGMLAAVSFFISALVQIQIDKSPEKTVNMLWLVPQYIVITMGEVMLSITGYALTYEHAPRGLKSVVQSLWHSTYMFGDVILLFIVKCSLFTSQAHEFLLFALIMVIDMVIFMAISMKDRKFKVLFVDLVQFFVHAHSVATK